MDRPPARSVQVTRRPEGEEGSVVFLVLFHCSDRLQGGTRAFVSFLGRSDLVLVEVEGNGIGVRPRGA